MRLVWLPSFSPDDVAAVGVLEVAVAELIASTFECIRMDVSQSAAEGRTRLA